MRDDGGTARHILGTIGMAWLTMTTLILVMANEVAIPLDFLVRPTLVTLLPATVVGVACTAAGSLSRLLAILAAPLILIPDLWPVAAGLGVIEIAIWLAQRHRTSKRLAVGRFAQFAILVLLGVSIVRLMPSVGDYVPSPSGSPDAAGPPVYMLLLDGYPRADELARIGIDNTGFVAELETRGFDHYPDATSAHAWTNRTLQAMVAGSSEGIPDEEGSNAEFQRVRAGLQLPTGFVAIDPPVSHVVMRGGDQRSAGGMNDFEIRLLGTSIVGGIARDWAAGLVTDSLRRHFEHSLKLMVASDSTRTFAHVLAPHPPFLYAGGVSECWPRCNIFEASFAKLDMTLQEWSDRMDDQLAAVNSHVLSAVDEVVERHPNAVIILFSDHGGRYEVENAEVHHTFLAARTPGNPRLFAAEPHPDALLRVTLAAYP